MSSPWLTSGTTSLTPPSFIAASAGESRSSFSTSTTPETLARYVRIGSFGAISSSGAACCGTSATAGVSSGVLRPSRLKRFCQNPRLFLVCAVI
jgi:hypothetical protein